MVIAEAESVVETPTVTAPVYVCEPEVVTLLVLIAVVPLTERFFAEPLSVTVSAAASPNTALPVIAKP